MLYKNSNLIASKIQVHSFSHNKTCFKYDTAIKKKSQFNFFCPYIEKTRITKLGSIEISGNNPQMNSWNPALTLLVKSNYDINSIFFNVKALAVACYITNYATKRDYSQYQQVISAAFI